MAPRDAVWRALNDPAVLARCIEGCEAMTRVGDDAFEAKIKARVGPVSALFSAEIRLENVSPPSSYTLKGSVNGGAAGLGKGAANVTLTEEGAATLLRYDVEGGVSGKLAQIGQRLIDAAARKTAEDFFARFSQEVAPAVAQEAPVASRSWSAPMVWVGAGVLVVALVLIAVLIAR